MKTIPQKSIDLILEEEGMDQPWKWPGGGSGITLGHGCDIGADPESLDFWRDILPPNQIKILEQAKGRTGRRAAEIQTRFHGINITRAEADKVFIERNLPREIDRTLKAFPGVGDMPPLVLGAMVSLVFNRGTDITDDPGSSRRREMRIIHEILADFGSMDGAEQARVRDEYIHKIAKQIRSMKRIWRGQGLPGLLKRRDAEAAMVEEASA